MANDYSKLSKDDLLKTIEKLESRKKYGLIWDEERTKEQFEKESENALPVLKEVKGKEIKTDPSKPVNILIEGDNYHALSVLNYTHQGKIDVIYIDPPYNTGSGDFKYNDKWVNDEDSYRHSKWLSFMSKRLKLAKNLLKESGVILIQIDDNEIAQLKMLMDDIFGEDNFRNNIIWAYRTGGAPSKKDVFSKKHDYILFYSKNRDLFYFNRLKEKIIYEKNFFGAKKDDNGKFYADVNLRDFIEGEFTLMKDGVLYKKINVKPVLNLSSERVENFPSQKPKGLMKFLFEVLTPQNAVVLDFFAGSGSTAYSVLELNKEEKRNIQFILCTNNESNICYDFCYPRLKKLLKEFKANLKYFKNSFIKKPINRDSLKVRITQECTEMLCLREGIFEEVKKTDDYRIFEHNDRFMGVYYSLERAELKSLKKDLDKMKGKKILYCFTLDPLGLDKKDFRDWKGVSLEPIPQKILDIYEDIYEY
ncbi:MAG: Modification methylase DpnIIB [bacterium ADurb.BinA186]|nr:MAG: Modification methylase DpnIIB [bacterium ADurb.BinA186]